MADSELSVESTRPSSDDVKKGEKHGVVEHKKCEHVEHDEKCVRPATMECAYCGTSICEFHTKHGRFCSEDCYSAAKMSGWGEEEEVEENEGTSILMKGIAIIVILSFVIAALVYLGVLDPNSILSMIPAELRSALPL